MAANVFRRVHSKKTVKITNLYYETPKNAFNGGDIRDKDDEIIIQHFGTALKVLKYFGNSISHIKISFNRNEPYLKDNSSIITLNKAINENCSETLLNLELIGSGKILEEMTKPFKQVKQFSVRHDSLKDLGSNSLSFNELFPALESFDSKYIEVKNINCLDHEFPNLQHVRIKVPHRDNGKQSPEIESFLRKNPQINSLKIDNSNKKILRYVNDVLPNLEQLHINGYNTDSDDGILIKFENVKNLTIYAYYGCGELYENIKFENLVELHVIPSRYENGNKWIQFAKTSRHLKKLFVESGDNDMKLEMLEQFGPNFNEISLELEPKTSDASIINYVKKCDKIKKIHIKRFGKPYSLKPVAMALRDDLDHKRKITETVFQLWIE